MLLALLSAPVTFLSYVWAMKLMVDSVSMWVFLAFCLAHVVTVLGFASLIDTRRERQNLPPL